MVCIQITTSLIFSGLRCQGYKQGYGKRIIGLGRPPPTWWRLNNNTRLVPVYTSPTVSQSIQVIGVRVTSKQSESVKQDVHQALERGWCGATAFRSAGSLLDWVVVVRETRAREGSHYVEKGEDTVESHPRHFSRLTDINKPLLQP